MIELNHWRLHIATGSARSGT